jgi:hypothetical protein
VGIGLCVLGSAWIVWTFALKLLADHKTERFHELIGRAMDSARSLQATATRDNLPQFEAEAQAWADEVADLVQAALGPAAKSRFLTTPRHVGAWVAGAAAVRWLDDRLKRLAEILTEATRVSLTFDHKRDWLTR